ncbi:hypothetical protein BT96DRAFT_1060589 [Gymnopus androsaceus JB14]|uniref:Uncharacterized protein n=1 Tax=Gymnopus androsaceus JB14 TaxID=1447944 RepID=A0A6A4I272_9AGAR|nr:hypothetical protein BT96DRAFT_1060589 [Gymnopus androsaceus JB14]
MSDLQNELREFLRQPPKDAEPLTIPPHFGHLLPQDYVEIALDYIDEYPFDRTLPINQLRKARDYLRACVTVDRSGLACIADPKYDPGQQQQRFIHQVVFKLLLETNEASSVVTPTDTDDLRKQSLVDKVKDRDFNCRMTGLARKKKKYANWEAQRGRASLEASAFVTALTGIPTDNWEADGIENAFLIQASLHKLFGAFQLYLEFIIRARTGAADPLFDLAAVVNDQRRICDEPGALIDIPLRPRRNETIPDIRMKFFVLHKFIGDIVWMCGGAGTDYDEEKEEDEENLKVLSNYNFDEIVRKLNSPWYELFVAGGYVWKNLGAEGS